MSDDLVKRLRGLPLQEQGALCEEAADRIEELEATIEAYNQIGDRIKNAHASLKEGKVNNDKEIKTDEMNDDEEDDPMIIGYKLGSVITKALNECVKFDMQLRIEQLETALREIASLDFWDGDSAMGIARKALEGKKDEQ